MKFLISFIGAASVMLSGLPPAFGFSLLKSGKTHSVNRWPYSFGDRFIYDNAGSHWDYDSVHRHKEYPYHRTKHRRLRINYNHERPGNEKLNGLIKHDTGHIPHNKSPFHSARPFYSDQIGR